MCADGLQLSFIKEKRLWNSLTLLSKFFRLWLSLWPGWGGAIVLAVWVLLANLPFILIQRYNRPRLMRLAALLRKRAQRKGEQNARTDPDL